jgi:CMP-N-acetylneuraminic acid synthetase
MNKLKIYAMIPARFGSTRLKMKNLALIDGRPMISYVVNAAQDSGIFDKIIINSDHDVFKSIAVRYNVDFYHRPENLGSSSAKSDSVVADFMEVFPDADIVVWVNSIAPFQTGEEISKVVDYFINNKLDSLITVEDQQVHCNFKNQAVNYDLNGLFAQTQDLLPVQPFVYSIMMWRRATFLEEFTKNGYALFCGNFGVFSVSKLSNNIIKTAEDLKLADLLMRSINMSSGYQVKYDNLVKNYQN